MSATDLPPVEPELPPVGLLTQAAAYINDTLGRPMSFSTATKLAALGEFAAPALWWGRRPLYRAKDLEHWAEGRSSYRRLPSPFKVARQAADEATSTISKSRPRVLATSTLKQRLQSSR
jgi:hypothetical protein